MADSAEKVLVHELHQLLPFSNFDDENVGRNLLQALHEAGYCLLDRDEVARVDAWAEMVRSEAPSYALDESGQPFGARDEAIQIKLRRTAEGET